MMRRSANGSEMTGAVRFFAVVAVCLAVLSMPALAEDPENWTCQDDTCTEIRATSVINLDGTFDYGVALSPERDADQLAALEQQRWREYRFDVIAPLRLDLNFKLDAGDIPEGWPADIKLPTDRARVSVHVSRDGETYTPVSANAVLPVGAFLSVLVAQATQTLPEGGTSFFPARWSLQVAARRVLPKDNLLGSHGSAALNISSGVAPLGCRQMGCGAPVVEQGPVVQLPRPLQPDATALAPQEPATRSSESTPLALELQKELARVGCYQGEIDGLWGPASRRAMTDFNRAAGTDATVAIPSPNALATVARTPDLTCNAN